MREVNYKPPSYNIKDSTFCSHGLFMWSLWISERTSVICVYSISELVFITETECVYFTVRTESVTVMPVKFRQNCKTFR